MSLVTSNIKSILHTKLLISIGCLNVPISKAAKIYRFDPARFNLLTGCSKKKHDL